MTKLEYKPIKFPHDELKHPTVGEWWYFNGNLTGEDGQSYAYMNTLFRAKIPLTTEEKWNKLPSANTYFYHSIISDIGGSRFYPHIDNVAIVSRDSFNGPLLNIYFTKPLKTLNYHAYYIEEPKPFCYRIKGPGLMLDLKSKKKPLLENETGYVDFNNKPTYYYSLRNMETKGIIEVEGKKIKVKGKSWMDHQWANVASIDNDYWNWFSIQLDNDIELVCYEHGISNKSFLLATISNHDGSQISYYNLSIVPLGYKWKSEATGAIYDLEWQIKSDEIDIDLIVKSRVLEHEMNFLNINYWEGPTEISGTFRGKQTNGYGYMELAGRSSVFVNFNHIMKKAKNKINERIKRK